MEIVAPAATFLLILIFALLAIRESKRKEVFIDPEDIKNPAGEKEFVAYLIDGPALKGTGNQKVGEWYRYLTDILPALRMSFVMDNGRSLFLISPEQSLRNAAQAIAMLQASGDLPKKI